MEFHGVSKTMILLIVIVLSLLCGLATSKHCTNVFPAMASHTFRSALLSSDNETWKNEVYSHYHTTPTDDQAWSGLMPRKMLKEEDELDWAMAYKKMKFSSHSQKGDFFKEVSLHDVRLDPSSIQWRGQQTNLEYLLMLDVDRLVWSFRKTANITTIGQPYGGWEDANSQLRGHFVGHFLSASAMMWASTHNDTLKAKMQAVVAALAECQERHGDGYLSAFPKQYFDLFESLQPVWAPYYTIHKIMAGLLDQHTIAGNPHTLKMLTAMANYFYIRVQNVIKNFSVERHYNGMNEETGGMNDVLYRLFMITGDKRHLVLAHLFDKPCFLGILAVQADDISDYHTNTHIPLVIGGQMRYEVTGDELYREIAKFFLESVNSSHAYATGGTSVGEFWRDPMRLATTLISETEESCTTYNMLKVSRNLFRWTKEVSYADHYERAITNGVLSIQRGIDPGVMIYMLPLAPGSSKLNSNHGWGNPFESFWCCYGTAIESFSKLGDSIYFEGGGKQPSLYIIQYVSSTLDWKSADMKINQTVYPIVSTDPYVRVTITISSGKGTSILSTLNLRIPIWTQLDGAEALVNGKSVPMVAPGNYLTINRKWSDGDRLTLQLPIYLRTEAIKDDRPQYATLQAILYGHILLAGHSYSGDWNVTSVESRPLTDWITPIPPAYNDQLVTFSQESAGMELGLRNMNNSITLDEVPEPGMNCSVHSTFRLVFDAAASGKPIKYSAAIGQAVKLEPFDLPGSVVVHQGKEAGLIVSNNCSTKTPATFRLVPGLDGKSGTVSLESVDLKDCFVFSNRTAKGEVKLSCRSNNTNSVFSDATSFVMSKGISEYHPISFVAKGGNRNYLLEPLFSFRDELYSVYFNFEHEEVRGSTH